MAIITRDNFGSQAETYKLNLRELCDDQEHILANEVAENGTVTLTRDELKRIKTILEGLDL